MRLLIDTNILLDVLQVREPYFMDALQLWSYCEEKAADMKWRDFEDAVQSETASRINADYIITRNAKDFDVNRVRAITPEEYFAEIFTV